MTDILVDSIYVPVGFSYAVIFHNFESRNLIITQQNPLDMHYFERNAESMVNTQIYTHCRIMEQGHLTFTLPLQVFLNKQNSTKTIDSYLLTLNLYITYHC